VGKKRCEDINKKKNDETTTGKEEMHIIKGSIRSGDVL